MRFVILFLFVLFSYGCTFDKYEPLSSNDFGHLINNIRIKDQNEHSVTYEYKNVRIDEVAFIASEYCYNHDNKRAVLLSSELYKNFSRRATFNCI